MLSEREKKLRQSLEDLLEYCHEHEGSCDGCIFYKRVKFGSLYSGVCEYEGRHIVVEDDNSSWFD